MANKFKIIYDFKKKMLNIGQFKMSPVNSRVYGLNLANNVLIECPGAYVPFIYLSFCF
jgi:hypothetical protein